MFSETVVSWSGTPPPPGVFDNCEASDYIYANAHEDRVNENTTSIIFFNSLIEIPSYLCTISLSSCPPLLRDIWSTLLFTQHSILPRIVFFCLYPSLSVSFSLFSFSLFLSALLSLGIHGQLYSLFNLQFYEE